MDFLPIIYLFFITVIIITIVTKNYLSLREKCNEQLLYEKLFEERCWNHFALDYANIVNIDLIKGCQGGYICEAFVYGKD